MSYIFNNAIKYSDSSNLDAFGRLRVSNVTSLLEVTHMYDKQPYLIDEVTGGTAVSYFDSDNSQVVMSGTGEDSYVIRQTFTSATYQPGKSQIFEMSFSNFQLQSEVIKRVGYFDTASGDTYSTNIDGIFLESNGITNEISFQIWKSGSLTYSSDTTNWNSDVVDPTTIDWTKTQLILCDFQWLGVGRVRFGMVFNGQTVVFDNLSGTDNLTNVYMTNSNHPIRYELRTSGGTGSLNMICAQVSMEGSLNQLVTPIGITGPISPVTFTAVGTKYPFIGVKMNSGYENISLLTEQINILNTSNDNYYCTLEIDPTISGNYAFTATSQTEVLKSIGNGTQTVTGSNEILACFTGQAGTSASSTFVTVDSIVTPGKYLSGQAQELWVCITPLGANASFLGSMYLTYRK
jgi:hypothetical protein